MRSALSSTRRAMASRAFFVALRGSRGPPLGFPDWPLTKGIASLCLCQRRLPRMRSALASIFAALDLLRWPALTCWVARALALAAWARSGIGYFLEPGRPNSDFGRAARCLDVSLLTGANPCDPSVSDHWGARRDFVLAA